MPCCPMFRAFLLLVGLATLVTAGWLIARVALAM